MFSKVVPVEPLDFEELDETALFEEGGASAADVPDMESNGSMTALEGANFSGLIRHIGDQDWRATAWVRLESLQKVLEQRIGPKSFATMPLARQWLRRAGAVRGFENFEIVASPAGDEGLLVQCVHPDLIARTLLPNDVDA
jgi:hypothetical protein